jgi:hypothetical protein
MAVPDTNKRVYSSVSHTGSGNYMGTDEVVTRSRHALTAAGQ